MNALGWGNYANDHEDAQRPVRAELRLRRRADHGRPGDHRALPDLGARRAARHDRDVHAQAVRRPHRQRAAPAPVAVEGRRARSSRPATATGRARPRPLAAGLRVPRRHPRARPRHAGGARADGELLQAHRSDRRPRSGATWSPRRATYGGNDRTHFVRIPDGHRIELRGGDGSANPYLAIAAALAAGLDGVDARARPGRPRAGRARPADCRRRCCTPSTRSAADPVVTELWTRPARASRVLRRAQARGVLRLAQHGRLRGSSTATSPPSDRTTERRTGKELRLCAGSSGSTCATPAAPAARDACWRPCCARSSNAAPTRPGSPSTATAAAARKGTPRSRCSTRPGDLAATADGAAARTPECWSPRRATPPSSPHRSPPTSSPPRSVRPRRTRWSSAPARDLTVYKGTGHPRELAAHLRPRRGARGWQGLAHTRMATESAVDPGGLPPVLRRPRPVPGAQRLVRQPRHDPPRAAGRGHGVRLGERLRGRRPLRRRPGWRRARTSRRRCVRSASASTASTRCW